MEPEIQKEDIESHWMTTTKSVYTAANYKLKELGSEKPEKVLIEIITGKTGVLGRSSYILD
jgi:hypothetical protein